MQGKLARAAASTVAASAITAGGLVFAQVAQAAPAVVDVACSATSLASDMSSASSGETLSLATGCVYRLTAGLPAVSQDLVIMGHGATLERSFASGTPAFTILEVDSGTVAISGLNFRNGRGAIVVNDIGNVIVTGGTFTGNTADDGGAIFDFSVVGATVADSTFSGNQAVHGGAIFADPDLETSLSGVVIHGNRATVGGGIYNATGVGIMNSQIHGNHAWRQGGGLYSAEAGDAEVTGTVLQGNGAQDGAAIYNADGIANFNHDAIVGNQAEAAGGGIYDAGDPAGELGSVSLTGSEISRNHAGARGGGIYNNAGEVYAASTQIVRNEAATGGGIDDHGTVTVTLTGSAVIKNKPDNCEPAGSITACAS